MVLRSSPGEKCFSHQQPCVGICSWCSKGVCQSCVMEAGGKKYCAQCMKKRGKADAPMPAEKKFMGEAPRQPIRNVDPSFQQRR